MPRRETRVRKKVNENNKARGELVEIDGNMSATRLFYFLLFQFVSTSVTLWESTYKSIQSTTNCRHLHTYAQAHTIYSIHIFSAIYFSWLCHIRVQLNKLCSFRNISFRLLLSSLLAVRLSTFCYFCFLFLDSDFLCITFIVESTKLVIVD